MPEVIVIYQHSCVILVIKKKNTVITGGKLDINIKKTVVKQIILVWK